MKKSRKQLLFNLCLSGIMAALYVGFDFLATNFSAVFGGNIKISLSGLPIMIVAVFSGPLYAMASGFVGAFIGQLISPYGLTATTLLWVLPAVIRGASMGLLYLAFKRNEKFGILALESVISSILVTGANTFVMYADSKIYHYYSFEYVFGGLIVRIITGVATAIVFALILGPIIKALRKIKI